MLTATATTVSGLLVAKIEGHGMLWELTPDEEIALSGYRHVRDYGGSLHVEFYNGRATKWDVRPQIGNTEALNNALGKARLRG